MSPTSYQAALPRVIPSLLSATLIIIPYSNGFVKRVRKVFLQRKQRMKTRLPTFFPENQQPRQFTPLREGRRWEARWESHRHISIHAPPRGATTPCSQKCTRSNFNSRPSARGDAPSYTPDASPSHFNSRPSARGDLLRHRERHALAISIHAPPRGATIVAGESELDVNISIHAPPRGATRPNSSKSTPLTDFNSRPSARGDEVFRIFLRFFQISIHAPPRGATRLI